MDKKLKRAAQEAFRAVQKAQEPLDMKECFKIFKNIKSAVEELGDAMGSKLKVVPADVTSLFKESPRLHPNTLHYHVTQEFQEGERTLVSIYMIPEKGLLEFYNNGENPFLNSKGIVGNERIFFRN